MLAKNQFVIEECGNNAIYGYLVFVHYEEGEELEEGVVAVSNTLEEGVQRGVLYLEELANGVINTPLEQWQKYSVN